MTERPRRVLVVDDDVAIRQLIVDALDFDGYEARGADDGEVAPRVLETWSPDAIILDLMMPGLDAWGFREGQRTRHLALDVPVIVLSAGRDLRHRTAGLNPAAIIPKPFDLGVFLRTVHEITSSSRGAPAG